MTKVLVAGMGNILRGDDGFGVEVARRLAATDGLPDGVRVVEVGIGGIHLVQELMDGYDVLVIVDAVEQGSAPGTVHLFEAEVDDIAEWPENQRADFFADMHYSTPSKALILARALGVLPPRTWIIGCQPAELGDLAIGLTDAAERAVQETVAEIEQIIARVSEPAGAARAGG
jgi:hydrogenase maturation protease